MNKYLVIPTTPIFEYDVYFNRKRKQNYKIKKSIFNFIILEKIEKVEGKYILFEEDHEDIEEVFKSKYVRLGYTLNNNIHSIKPQESKTNIRNLSIGVIVSLLLSLTLIYLIAISNSIGGYVVFSILEVLLFMNTLYGVNNVIDLIKITRKSPKAISRFDIARKSVQFLSLILGLILILMTLATQIIPVTEASLVFHYFIWLGIFVFFAGFIIIKLYDNSIQALGMVLITAMIFFFFQSTLYAQLFIQLIQSAL